MASVSASSLIMFIAAVSIAVAVSGTMVNSVAGISDSIDQRGVDVSDQIDTDIEIISDAGSGAVYDDTNGEVTVLVKNVGSRPLDARPESVDVLVDGRYVESSNLSVTVYDSQQWREGTVAELVVSRSLGGGEHRVVVIVDGEQELLRFYV